MGIIVHGGDDELSFSFQLLQISHRQGKQKYLARTRSLAESGIAIEQFQGDRQQLPTSAAGFARRAGCRSVCAATSERPAEAYAKHSALRGLRELRAHGKKFEAFRIPRVSGPPRQRCHRAVCVTGIKRSPIIGAVLNGSQKIRQWVPERYTGPFSCSSQNSPSDFRTGKPMSPVNFENVIAEVYQSAESFKFRELLLMRCRCIHRPAKTASPAIKAMARIANDEAAHLSVPSSMASQLRINNSNKPHQRATRARWGLALFPLRNRVRMGRGLEIHPVCPEDFDRRIWCLPGLPALIINRLLAQGHQAGRFPAHQGP